MAFEYHIHKKGRIQGRGSSPRDLQSRRRLQSAEDTKVTEKLLQQVLDLKQELDKIKREGANAPPAISGYTEEEFNTELEKALLREIKVLELKYKSKYESLLALKDSKIESLEELIKSKDETIATLTVAISNRNQSSENNNQTITESNRPSIEESVIDPSENVEMESHIDVNEIKEDNSMASKLDQLKVVLGK